MAIPRSKEDVLDPNYRISENPDNAELEAWLSWLHTGVYDAYVMAAKCKLDLEEAEQQLDVTEATELEKMPDDMNITTKKMALQANDKIIEAKKKVRESKYALGVANATIEMMSEKCNGVRKIATIRANTVQLAEDTEWTARQNRKNPGVALQNDDRYYPVHQQIPYQQQQNNFQNNAFGNQNNAFGNQQPNQNYPNFSPINQ